MIGVFSNEWFGICLTQFGIFWVSCGYISILFYIFGLIISIIKYRWVKFRYLEMSMIIGGTPLAIASCLFLFPTLGVVSLAMSIAFMLFMINIGGALKTPKKSFNNKIERNKTKTIEYLNKYNIKEY